MYNSISKSIVTQKYNKFS